MARQCVSTTSQGHTPSLGSPFRLIVAESGWEPPTPTPRALPPTPPMHRAPQRPSDRPSRHRTQGKGKHRDKPPQQLLYSCPSPPGPLRSRMTVGEFRTPLPSMAQARRFFFYPVPDDVSVADLREELRRRIGPVATLHVSDGLADVRFQSAPGIGALNYCKLE